MHQKPLVLLGAVWPIAAAAGSLPRGVGPDFAAFYKDKTQFSCISNKAITLSSSQVNDNSCDCPDGSDEPGTAACAFLDPLSPEQPLPDSASGTTNTTNALPGFWCANEGHIGAYVPFMFVNDGICDYDICCDGSEEFAGVGGVKCENRCGPIGKEFRKLAEEKRKKMEQAGKQRKTMAEEAQSLRKQVVARIAELTEEARKLDVKTSELKKKHADAVKEDRGRVVHGEGSGGKLGVLVGLAKKRVDELRNSLENVMTQRDDLYNRVEELEGILRKFKEEYNPNFNDEGVKSAVKSWEDYAAREDPPTTQIPDSDLEEVLKEDSETSGVNWKEFENAGDDTDIIYSFDAYIPAFLRTIIQDRIAGIRAWLVENGMLAEKDNAGSESHVVKAAREAFEAVERELKKANKDLDKEKEDLEKNYGPSDIFRALKGKCSSIEAGEYTYELCWMDKTAQKSKKGGGNTNMGDFARIDYEMADDEDRIDGKSLGKGERMVLRYEDGQQCWNGPKRRTDVWLGCAETEEVWRVSEAEKCVYKMEVGTPAACEPEEKVEQPAAKDEL